MANNYYTNLTNLRANVWPVAAGTVSDTLMDAYAKHAYHVINARLKARFGGSVPFDTYGDSLTPPGIIEEVSDMLTTCYGRRVTAGHSIKTGGPLPDICSDAEALLKGLADGSVEVAEVTPTLLLDSSDRGEHPIFVALDELDQRQDTDQIDRLTDERSGD